MEPVEQLGLFVARVEELADSRLIRRGFNPGITMNWNRMQGLRFESRQPDEDDLRSFMLTFRQFVSPKEPVFLRRIYNLCQIHLTSAELRGRLVESREAWKAAYAGAGISVVFNDREMTPEYVMDLWINGYYFHSDEQKMIALRTLLPFEWMLVRFVFLNFVVEATKQVLYGGNIVKIAIREGLAKNKP